MKFRIFYILQIDMMLLQIDMMLEEAMRPKIQFKW